MADHSRQSIFLLLKHIKHYIVTYLKQTCLQLTGPAFLETDIFYHQGNGTGVAF